MSHHDDRSAAPAAATASRTMTYSTAVSLA
jgi:hypothetical protein